MPSCDLNELHNSTEYDLFSPEHLIFLLDFLQHYKTCITPFNGLLNHYKDLQRTEGISITNYLRSVQYFTFHFSNPIIFVIHYIFVGILNNFSTKNFFAKTSYVVCQMVHFDMFHFHPFFCALWALYVFWWLWFLILPVYVLLFLSLIIVHRFMFFIPTAMSKVDWKGTFIFFAIFGNSFYVY